jgi:hypothetical protein
MESQWRTTSGLKVEMGEGRRRVIPAGEKIRVIDDPKYAGEGFVRVFWSGHEKGIVGTRARVDDLRSCATAIEGGLSPETLDPLSQY